MASLDLTSADAAMKQLYKQKNFNKATYDRRPILAKLPKQEDFYGRNMPLVIQYGNPQGVSATFSTAQSSTTSSLFEDFLLTRINMHSVATIDGETLDAMSSDAGAFLNAMKAQVDAAMRSLSDRIESLLPGTGTGKLGAISTGSTVSTDTITLLNVNDIVNFEVGMSVVASQTDGGALRNSGASTTIEAVNRREGKLTTTEAAWNTTIAALATSDSLYAKGDAQNGGSMKVYAGLAGWLPSTVPGGSDNWFGVNRSLDSRLYGNYHDGTTQTIEEALIDAQSVAAREGGKPDVAFLNHVQNRKLIKELGSKVEYSKSPASSGGKAVADVSFRSVVIHGDSGDIDVLAANKIPSDAAYVLEIGTWALCSIGPITKWNDRDGNRVLRQSSSDGVEARLVSRGNLGCMTPSYNTRAALAA